MPKEKSFTRKGFMKGTTNVVERNLPTILKNFILNNPALQAGRGAEATKSFYQGRGINMIDSQIKKGKKWLVELKSNIQVIKDNLASFRRRFGSNVDDTLAKEKILAYELKVAKVEAYITAAETYKELIQYQDTAKKEDEQAVKRGYKDAEEAKALRQVEIEWYFNLYGTADPIEILAFQRIEKRQYGMTSYQAALDGKSLVLTDSQKEDAANTAMDMQDDVDQSQGRTQKLVVYGGGITLLLALGFMLLRKK